MNNISVALKDICSYIGASKLYYICYFINNLFKNNRFDGMLGKYQSLIEATIEL